MEEELIIRPNKTIEEGGRVYRINSIDLDLIEDDMIDGGLRKLFREHLPEAQWTSIETGSTGLGVPDAEYCFEDGAQGWIEFKVASANKVRISPEQSAWIERRHRLGGRVFVMVRQKAEAGVRREAVDALYLYRGEYVRSVMTNGLKTISHSHWEGGPAKWGWKKIEGLLRGTIK